MNTGVNMKPYILMLTLLVTLSLSAAPSLRPSLPREAPAAPSLSREQHIDLYYYSEYESDDWAQKARYDYTWNEANLAVTLQVDTLVTSWEPTYMYEYSYDDLGRNTQILLQDWDNGWVNDWRYDITYNDNDDIAEYFYRQWNGSGWVDYLQILYTYSGTELVQEERIYFTRQLDYRCDYSYDDQSRCIEELWQANIGSGWVNDSRATYDWNNEALAMETWDFWFGEWTHYSQTEYAYDDSDWLSTLVVSYWTDNDWLVTEMYTYTYDSMGYTRVYNYYAWIAGDDDWTPFWRYEYMWEQVNGVDENTPLMTASLQAWPNPFNPVTTVSFSLETAGHVDLAIYNIKGERVETLVSAPMSAGEHKIVWNAEGIASGVYFIRLRAAGETTTSKVMLLK